MPIKNKHTTTTASVMQQKNLSDYYTVTDSFDEPLIRIHKKELENKLKKFIDYLKECGYVLDEVTATPIRDHQVFHQQSFDLIFSDPATLGITFAAMLISSGLIAAKVYNKNTATSFHEVIRNLNNEVGAKFAKEFFDGEGQESETFKAQSEKLIKALEDDLLYEEHNFNVKPILVKKQDGGKYHYDVEYVLSDHVSKFLGTGTSKKVATNKIYTQLERSELEKAISEHASEYTNVSKNTASNNVSNKKSFNFKSLFGSKKEYIPVSFSVPEYSQKSYKDFTLSDVLQESFDFDKKGDMQTLDWLESFLDDNLNSELMRRIVIDAHDEGINFDQLTPYERIKYKLSFLGKKLAKLSKGDLETFGEEKAKNIMALVKLLPLFFGKKGEFDEELTINQSRINFLKKLQEFDPKKAALGGINFADEISFNYWCVFIFFDMAQTNSDSCTWSVTTLAAALGLTYGYSIARKTVAEANKAAKSPNPEKIAELTEQNGNTYYDDDLKHRQMVRLFIDEAYAVQSNNISEEEKKKQLSEIDLPRYVIEQKEKELNELVSEDRMLKENELSELKHNQRKFENRKNFIFHTLQEEIKKIEEMETVPTAQIKNNNAFNTFLGQINSVGEHAQLLREQFSDKQKVTKSVTAFGWALRVGIMLSFIQWVAGVTIFGVAKLLTVFSTPGANAFATAVNAAFNLGWVGGVFGVGVFLVGMGIGAGIYAFKTRNELKESRETLKKRFEENEDKINELELIEAKNSKLRQLVKQRFGNDSDTKMLQLSSDRDNRRIKTGRNPIITALKEIGDNLRYAVNKLGQAVLAHRSIVFPTLGLLGMTGLAKVAIIGGVAGAVIGAIAPFTLPAIIVVLGISAIWMGITTYKYMKDKQYRSANDFLDRVKNGTLKKQAEAEHELLLEKLNYNDRAVKTEAPVNSISSEATILSALNAGQVEKSDSIFTSAKATVNNVKNIISQKVAPKPTVTTNNAEDLIKVTPNAGESMTKPETKEPNRNSFWGGGILNNIASVVSAVLCSAK